MMENFKYFKVTVDGNKLIMTTFRVENVDKYDFIDEFSMYLFINWFDSVKHIVFVILKEMFKNVFDHGTGEATLILYKHGTNYSFEFVDHNTEIVSYEACCKIERGKDWVQKNDANRNFGMNLINSSLGVEGVILNVDDTKGGINYSGSFFR